LHFAWFIAVRNLAPYYDEAIRLVQQYESSTSLLFPIDRFRCAAICALIAHERGQTEASRQYAAIARQAASEDHSGLRYHPALGLVGSLDSKIAERLAAIDGV
jgi:hypothetical protein